VRHTEKKMRTVITILFLNISLLTFGQGFIEMDTISSNTELRKIVASEIEKTIMVDFTGDGQKDYICQTAFKENQEPVIFEYWISSDFKIIIKKQKWIDEYSFYRFVNIDSDPEPELFSASGFPEGIDYCFIDLDLNNGTEDTLFYFNPVIIENDEMYWGYPWDISDIIIRNEKNIIELKTSIDHKIERDGEITIPQNQTIFPAIFFKGHSTQPRVQVGEIKKIEWMNTEEIKVRTHNNVYKK